MSPVAAIRLAAALVLGLAPTVLTWGWIGSAESRLEEEAPSSEEAAPEVAVASAANEEYCTPELKRILRRVLRSCGLIDAEQRDPGNSDSARGCQPVDAKQVAQMSGADFNALFRPMKERGAIIQFEQGDAALDDGDRALIDRVFADQRGASYFFVVSRASPEGRVERNRELSQQRAEGLMSHLRQTFKDPELDREVGLLWLGEEFAQLDAEFCAWSRSGSDGQCSGDDLNRSAFVAWVDCRL